MTRDELIAAYADWLGQYHWTLFATLTFRGFPSPSRADRTFRRWTSEMKQEDGKDDFRWVRVTQHGACGDNLHYHVLIGGLRDVCRWHWMCRWDELAGDSMLTFYRHDYCRHDDGTLPSLPKIEHLDRPTGAIPYMVREADPNKDFEIEFEIPPIAKPSRAR
jgi:hypothetical protein